MAARIPPRTPRPVPAATGAVKVSIPTRPLEPESPGEVTLPPQKEGGKIFDCEPEEAVEKLVDEIKELLCAV